MGGGTLDQLRQFPPQQIVAVRFADYPAAADLDQITDQERYLPGDGGAVDCATILRYLAEHEFAGPVTLYPHPARFRGMTRDAIVEQASGPVRRALPSRRHQPQRQARTTSGRA